MRHIRKEVLVMPSTYAHYYFGQLVFKKLTSKQQYIVSQNRDLYDIGLHGPDILFYHQPLIKNPICAYGHQLHDQSGFDFFKKAIDTYRQQKNQESHLSYLYGFVCHFTLDAICHPYVEKYKREQHVSHSRIEVAFDRSLLEANGFNPIHYHLTQHILPSRKASEVISPYFALTKPENIMKSLKSMRFYDRLLYAKNPIKRFVLNTALDLVGQSAFKDQIMLKEDDLRCTISNQALNQLLNQAVDVAIQLIASLDLAIEQNQALDALFNHTFGEN